jgi:ankyrin repeat protein
LERLAKFRDYPDFLITSLAASVCSGNEDIRKLVLDSAARVDQKDTDGSTVLHLLASQWQTTASLTVVELLLAKGADLEATDSWGWTPLHHAVQLSAASEQRTRSTNMIGHLLRKGANVHTETTAGNTPLHTAAERERCESRTMSMYSNKYKPTIASLLLDHGAEIDAKNAAGQTPLHLIWGNIPVFSSSLAAEPARMPTTAVARLYCTLR